MIILRQKYYSSKEQKAAKKAYELKRAHGEKSAPTKEEIQAQLDRIKDKEYQKSIEEDIKRGRKYNKRNALITDTVDSSINSRAVNRNSPGITASGYRLSNKTDNPIFSKKVLKKMDLHTYDHGKSSPMWNKEVMELRRNKIEDLKLSEDLATALSKNKRSLRTKTKSFLRRLFK